MFGAVAETEGRGSGLDCVEVVVVWGDNTAEVGVGEDAEEGGF